MEENKKEKKIPISKKAVASHILMLVLMISCIFILPHLNPEGPKQTWFYYAFSMFLACGAVLYSFFFEQKTSQGIVFWILPLLYLISVGVMALTKNPLNLPFWIFGGIFLLLVYDLRTGLFWNFFLFFLAGSIQPFLSAEIVWIQMFSLLLIGFFLPRKGKFLGYVRFLIVLGGGFLLSRLFFFLFFRSTIQKGTIGPVYLIYLLVILGCYIFLHLLSQQPGPDTLPEGFEYLEALATDNAENYDSMQEQTLSELCRDDAVLLLELKRTNPESYRHSIRVAAFSEKAARTISDTDDELVYAGGLYHEIGRLLGNNTKENTLQIAKEKHFPDSLCQVISSAGTKGDKPSTKEAAILLLSDQICTMIEYLKKTKQGNVLISQIIDKTITLYVNRGILNECGLTSEDLSEIRTSFADTIKEDLF